MRIEVDYVGVARNRTYFATPAGAGRPRKTSAITKSKKPFATGATREEAVQNLLDKLGWVAHKDLR
jgi:hypothetical protein